MGWLRVFGILHLNSLPHTADATLVGAERARKRFWLFFNGNDRCFHSARPGERRRSSRIRRAGLRVRRWAD